jgi:hypothetical protein
MTTLREWIETQSFQFKKINERPWGSYELLVIYDGRPCDMGRAFGWGFTEIQAMELALKEVLKHSNLHPQLITWLGQDKYTELMATDT